MFCLINVFSCLLSALDQRISLVVLALLLGLRVRDVEVRDCFRAMCVLRSGEVGSQAIVRRIREFRFRRNCHSFCVLHTMSLT